jgi:hypothetical protein
MLRSVIFISHATPEDNDFTIWLASRLQLLGYEVWVDRNGLLGGEKFWEDIDDVIRNKAIKILLVYSSKILKRGEAGKLKDGVYKEYSLAESIGKQNSLKDFIQLLNIDGSAYNLFIGADQYNQIPFWTNWASGLEQLFKKLQKDNVPQSTLSGDNNFGEWYERQYVTKHSILQKRELYYTNWWILKELPEYFYIFAFPKEEIANKISISPQDYPVSKISNHLASFSSEINMGVIEEEQTVTVKPKEIFKVRVFDVLNATHQGEFPSQNDAEIHLKRLLSRVFHMIMRKRGLRWYELSNKRLAYYFPKDYFYKDKISFVYAYGAQKGSKKSKKLVGKYYELGNWHFAISARPIFSPNLAYSLKSHITFTDNGVDAWDDKDKIHIHRRRKGKGFFNEHWRDLLFAFLNAIKNDQDYVTIALNKDFILKMDVWPEWFPTTFGYQEPQGNNRQGILMDINDSFEEEEEGNLNEETGQ